MNFPPDNLVKIIALALSKEDVLLDIYTYNK